MPATLIVAPLMAGEGERVPGVVRRVVQRGDRREADAPHQEGAEQRGHHRRDQRLRAHHGRRYDTLRADRLRLHQPLRPQSAVSG